MWLLARCFMFTNPCRETKGTLPLDLSIFIRTRIKHTAPSSASPHSLLEILWRYWGRYPLFDPQDNGDTPLYSKFIRTRDTVTVHIFHMPSTKIRKFKYWGRYPWGNIGDVSLCLLCTLIISRQTHRAVTRIDALSAEPKRSRGRSNDALIDVPDLQTRLCALRDPSRPMSPMAELTTSNTVPAWRNSNIPVIWLVITRIGPRIQRIKRPIESLGGVALS